MKNMKMSGKTVRIVLKQEDGGTVFSLLCDDEEVGTNARPRPLSNMAFDSGAWKVVHDYNLALDPDEQNAYRRK